MSHSQHRRRHALAEIEETAARFEERAEAHPNRCPNCRWSEPARAADRWLCHYEPPICNVHRPGESYYPTVTADDWCGRFEQ